MLVFSQIRGYWSYCFLPHPWCIHQNAAHRHSSLKILQAAKRPGPPVIVHGQATPSPRFAGSYDFLPVPYQYMPLNRYPERILSMTSWPYSACPRFPRQKSRQSHLLFRKERRRLTATRQQYNNGNCDIIS